MVLAIIALFADVRVACLQENRSPRPDRRSEATRAAATPGVRSGRRRAVGRRHRSGPGAQRRIGEPEGLAGVHRREGPWLVAHAVIEYVSSVRLTNLGGRDRPANTIEEVWYDARGGLWRDVVRSTDGSGAIGRAPAPSRRRRCRAAQSRLSATYVRS